jgi:TetR/AcrR family transcriptional repressor of bet genes
MARANVKDKRKQQLIEANITSIARRGLEGTTIAHVSEGADMSRGIVNFYFTSKENMMVETLAFLAEEYTSAWQGALEAKKQQTQAAVAHIEVILRTLLGDKLCSTRRMSVWTAFMGAAATHTPYAKIIRSMDDTLVAQLKLLWLEIAPDAKTAESCARQMQAYLRGHWLMSALGLDDKRPSYYADGWADLLEGVPAAPEDHFHAPVKAPSDAVVKQMPLRPAAQQPAANQLDFEELFLPLEEAS